MGETSLEKPRGSVFCVEVADQLLKPLALQVCAPPFNPLPPSPRPVTSGGGGGSL